MSNEIPGLFWWCTELYPTKDEDNVGMAGDFEVVRGEDYRALQQICEALQQQLAAFNDVRI